MALVRALTTIFHNGFLLKAGDTFEYADEFAKTLKGDVTEGIELVTKKTTAAFEKVKAAATQELHDKAASLRKAYEDLKAQLEADPTRGELVQKVLDAEQSALDAAREAAKSVESSISSLV